MLSTCVCPGKIEVWIGIYLCMKQSCFQPLTIPLAHSMELIEQVVLLDNRVSYPIRRRLIQIFSYIPDTLFRAVWPKTYLLNIRIINTHGFCFGAMWLDQQMNALALQQSSRK